MGVTYCKNPHAGGYEPNGSKGDWAQHVAEGHVITYVGAVLDTGEHNWHDDSDGYALVWDEESQSVKEVDTWTTRGWSYHDGASVDATRDVIAKAVAFRAAAYVERWVGEHGKRVTQGMTAHVTVKGETLTGVVGWVGESKPFTAWERKYGERKARYGVRVEGRDKMIFRNADSPSLVVDVPPLTEGERADLARQAKERARQDFSKALRLADEREPGPGDVVDSQEADGAGMRLYAVGAAVCDDGEWAQGVARAVVVESAGGYGVMGYRADGSEMPVRACTVFKALGHVARWADSEGAMISHNGAGVVRIVRRDGACLFLAPAGAQEGPQEAVSVPQGGEERQEAQEAQEGRADADGAEGAVDGVEWEARRDAALEALLALLDDSALRYRRTVLVKGSGAQGMSGTMPTDVAWVYLAEEIADGGGVLALGGGSL
ncbi:hypothetical protein AB0L54_35715, partial [Streptomyces sp. NPDC052196]|uniref:hypothetical protein n=1 Tax=Streptomyces sp. NPDC052196 TaxID=3156691 RepID=UPI00344ACC37